MKDVTQRSATLSDLKEIWGLVKGAAAEIPFEAGSEAAQESVLSELMMCCTSELSQVAVGEEKTIVGALLVRRDDFECGLRNSGAVHVTYAAVAPSHKDEGILEVLVANIQELKVPVLFSLKRGTQTAQAGQLEKLGFSHECTAGNGWGDLYRWNPVSKLH